MSGVNSYKESDEYKPDSGATVDVVAQGSDLSATERNASVEDREAADSEVSGRVPRREVEDLKANHFEGEGEDYGGRTRSGRGSDPYKAERDLDKALELEGVDREPDVEISRASGTA